MGWSFSYGWSNPSDVKRDLLRDYEGNDRVDVLAHKSTCYGRHWWVALKSKETGKSFIVLHLLARGSYGEWGYKDIDEQMGPVDVDCPVSLLDMTTEPTEGCAVAWRARVRGNAARKQTGFNVGDKCSIYGKTYEVVGKVKRSYLVAREGRTYKCGASKMKAI